MVFWHPVQHPVSRTLSCTSDFAYCQIAIPWLCVAIASPLADAMCLSALALALVFLSVSSSQLQNRLSNLFFTIHSTPLPHISPFNTLWFNTLCIHEIGLCNICFLVSVVYLITHAPSHSLCARLGFFSSHFSTLIAKGAHA